MENISEQVKKLRTTANNLSIGHNMPISLAIERFRKAADTIESLSAKLQAANMERSAEDCGGGWIPVLERLPTKEESIKNDNRFILDDGNRRYEGCFDYIDNRFVRFNCDGMQADECAIAWREMPEPYRP